MKTREKEDKRKGKKMKERQRKKKGRERKSEGKEKRTRKMAKKGDLILDSNAGEQEIRISGREKKGK